MLYEPAINIEGGDDVTTDSLSDGCLRLDDIKFTYPSKKEITITVTAVDDEVQNFACVAEGTALNGSVSERRVALRVAGILLLIVKGSKGIWIFYDLT